jgi:polyisoprenoid-binding protein YceI
MVGRAWSAALVLLLPGAAGAQAQHRWTVDAKYSLAWWQVDPHLNHLWATTCPAEPSWRPGEGRSSGWTVESGNDPRMDSYNARSDTINVPLYPRLTARPFCKEAVQGQIVVADLTTGRGVHGAVTVKADSLVMGEERRAKWARDAAIQTSLYPDIQFRLDSLVNVSRVADTLLGTAMGALSLHGHEKAVSATVRAYPDSESGGTRVLARIREPARDFVSDFWPGCLGWRACVFGLGVRTNIWKHMFMGADLVLRPVTPR